MRDRFDTFLDYLEAQGIASRDSLRGCTETEIETLEKRYDVVLPNAYRWYLVTMGHQSGRLFTHDHLAVFYSSVLELSADVRTAVQTATTAGHPYATLPHDALIIAGRLGQQFEFIRSTTAADSPVWYFNDWECTITASHRTILDWLYANAAQARSARLCPKLPVNGGA